MKNDNYRKFCSHFGYVCYIHTLIVTLQGNEKEVGNQKRAEMNLDAWGPLGKIKEPETHTTFRALTGWGLPFCCFASSTLAKCFLLRTFVFGKQKTFLEVR